MTNAAQLALDWTEQGRMPDTFIRAGIRRLVRERLKEIHADDCQSMANAQFRFIDSMDSAPVAPLPHKANEQHYELPAVVYGRMVKPTFHRLRRCRWMLPVNGRQSSTVNPYSNLAAGGVR